MLVISGQPFFFDYYDGIENAGVLLHKNGFF